MTVFVNPRGVKGPPAPGSTKPGDLYVDLQSRTLWLGVDAAVDPSQSVLISDIVSLMTEISNAETDANAYTDNALAPYALKDSPIFTGTPQVPQPPVGDSSALIPTTAWVTAAIGGRPNQFVRGMILMYSGSLADIGIGDLAGWALCNGSNGTPDLRDRFIMGAGNKAVGAVNPNASFLSSLAGSHIHTINATALTVAMMPAHDHGSITGYMSADHQHYTSGVTDAQGNHAHTYSQTINVSSQFTHGPNAGGIGSQAATTSTDGAHQHNWSAWSGGVSANHYHSIPAQGSGQAHTHTEAYAGDHQHTITSAQIRDSLPYYALAYIMRL